MVRFCQEMKVVEDGNYLNEVEPKTQVLLEGLNMLKKKYPEKIKNIRGMGLYQGFSLVKPERLSELIEYAQDNEHLILLEAGTDSVRFRPTLDVTVAEIKQMVEILDRCLYTLH